MIHSMIDIEPDMCVSDNEAISVLLSILVALGLLMSFFSTGV